MRSLLVRIQISAWDRSLAPLASSSATADIRSRWTRTQRRFQTIITKRSLTSGNEPRQRQLPPAVLPLPAIFWTGKACQERTVWCPRPAKDGGVSSNLIDRANFLSHLADRLEVASWRDSFWVAVLGVLSFRLKFGCRSAIQILADLHDFALDRI